MAAFYYEVLKSFRPWSIKAISLVSTWLKWRPTTTTAASPHAGVTAVDELHGVHIRGAQKLGGVLQQSASQERQREFQKQFGVARHEVAGFSLDILRAGMALATAFALPVVVLRHGFRRQRGWGRSLYRLPHLD